MAGRAPPQSLSIPAFSQNQQGPGSGGSDSFRARGRNRGSGGSNNGGSSSRDHSVESSRGERRGGGTPDFRAASRGGSWGGNQAAEVRGDGDARGFEGRGWGSSPKARMGATKWGSGSDSPNWRSNRGGLPQNGSRNGYGRGLGRGGFGPEGRGDYGRGNSQASGAWGSSNDSQKSNARGPAARFGGSKKDPSLDSPTRSRSSSRGLNRHHDGRQAARIPSWGNSKSFGDDNPPPRNAAGERGSARGGGWGKGSVQDARVPPSSHQGGFFQDDVDEVVGDYEAPSQFQLQSQNGDELEDEQQQQHHQHQHQQQQQQEEQEEAGYKGFPPQELRISSSDGNADGEEEDEEGAEKSLPLSPSPAGLGSLGGEGNAGDGDGNGDGEAARSVVSPAGTPPSQPRTPPSQGLRADAAEFNPETARLGLIKLPQIVSLRAEAAEYSPETPKDPLSPMTRRSTDWYEICLEEEEEEEQQALANKKREEAFGPPVVSSSPSSGARGEFTRRKSSLSRNSSGRKLDDASSNLLTSSPGASKKDFGRRNSFGSRTPNGKKRDDALGNHIHSPGAPKGELRRTGSFGRDVVGDTQSPRTRLGRKNSFSRDLGGDSPGGGSISSPGSAKGEFKPWNSVREDAADAAQPRAGANAQRTGESRSASRGDKYVPLALRNKGRNEPSNLKPSVNSPRGRKSGDPGDYFGPREENGRWRKGPGLEDSLTRSASVGGDTEDSVNSVTESFDQKNVNTAVRPAAFFRALNEATAVGDDDPLPHIVGTCTDMCPVKERLQRERLRDLAVFERVNGDLKKTSKELAVKKFCRTVVASELSQSDVRPLPVLWRTLQYLLGLLDDPEFPFDIVHSFLFDRTRAIRQELGMQRIRDYQNITIHEQVVRFHIISQHELRELNRKRSKQIDTHLNLQQLSKSLYSLLNLYISLGGEDGVQLDNEAEFHAYYVLLNLGSHGQLQAEPLSLWLPNVPSNVLQAPAMQFARKVLRCYRSNNFVGFFRLVNDATYLQSCLMELSFDAVRATALAMLNVAEYKLHPFPLLELGQLLLLEESQVEELCTYYGLRTGLEKGSEKLCLFVKQSTFTVPERSSLPYHSSPLIDSKRAPSLFQQVKGEKIEL
ncbi:nuclear mRNA export protein SAC3 [Marchantia polymorpha subsp. ruderalis]|uniref:SAC3/GANP/THP3 conserved domain-containing protein n=2 Tax=Marchantia polymorpha TaxID=3197 RepID=A0AAF6BSW9_MARPO|nr:hypothetical protein MARPO_0144s0009 [Marchantia polymorpha]BBN15103.1 hypothetical protein Mp_6g17060 [Marchantia polymorpha subsp. ruderalis]|eukprot:PTQ29289.1 hypothetical protein MARPO_0144s0009 [Marchantia polymorpha]